MLHVPAVPGSAVLANAVRTTVNLPRRVVAMVELGESVLARAHHSLLALDDIAKQASASLERADAVLDEAGSTIARTHVVLTATERITVRTDGVLDDTEGITVRTNTLLTDTERITTTANALTVRATGLVDQIDPLVTAATPLAQRFVSQFSEAEVEAAIALVDELPGLVRSLREDVIPILATLDHTGPDLRELLEVTHEVKQAIIGIPGFGFFRKRGAELEDQNDDQGP